MKNCWRKHKYIKHHYINCLNKEEKMCVAAIIGCSFMRGMCIGMFLNEK